MLRLASRTVLATVSLSAMMLQGACAQPGARPRGSQSDSVRFLGSWRMVGGPGVIEFLSDGRLSMTSPAITFEGRWAFFPDSRIKLQVSSPLFGPYGPVEMWARLRADTLELDRGSGGGVDTYVRADSTSSRSAAARAPEAGISYAFGPGRFALQLPDGYRLVGTRTIAAAFLDAVTWRFTTDPRPDSLRGLIEVTLVALSGPPARTQPPTEESIVAAELGRLRRGQSEWTQTDSTVEVTGVHARRIAWSATSAPSPERPFPTTSSAMRGVLIAGIKDALPFALHCQDSEPFAVGTLARCETALMSFTLTVQR